MKFIIDLNTKLSIYKSQDDLELELVYSKEKVNGTLNLSENFQDVFIDLLDSTTESESIFILYIGDNAGFMDSRIVYIWLRNNQYFRGQNFYVTRNRFDAKTESIESVIESGIQDLAYSKAPNIGKK